MEPRLKPVVALAAVAILAFALTTCSNPIDFVAEVTDAVMVAKDKYLEVVSTTPVKYAVDVNTWAPIIVEFDRDIDETTATQTTILFKDETDASVAWTPDYNEATKTLSIVPDSMNGDLEFTITITDGVKGADGTSIRSPYSWTFTTKPTPSGTVTINDPNGYVNVTGVTVAITKNLYAYKFRVCAANGAGEPTFDSGDGDWDEIATPDSPLATYPVTLLGTQGTNTVFIQFMDISNNRSPEDAIFDDIVFDTVKPTVDAGTMAWLNNATQSRMTNSTASDLTSGLLSFTWSGAGLTFSDSGILNPTISASADGTYTATIVVTDLAGNTESKPLTVNRDVTFPVVTTFNINSNALYTRLTNSTLTIAASDAYSGIDQVRFSSNGSSWLAWEGYVTSKAWTLATGDGDKYVYYQVRDFAGNVRQVNDGITLDQTAPTVSVSIDAGAATSNDTTVILNLTVNDATSGVRYYATRNDTLSWTSWMSYSTSTPTHVLQDAKGTRRVYVQLQDYAGNNSSIPYDEILLNARITVRYNEMLITDDGDLDLLFPTAGEIYYRFYIDGVLKLDRVTPLSVTAPEVITTAQLPQRTYTIYESPTSGSFQLTGRVYDDDGSVDDYGDMSAITYNAPFPASGTIIDTTRTVVGDVDGVISYTITYQN